jgi:hypothetical protein
VGGEEKKKGREKQEEGTVFLSLSFSLFSLSLSFQL